MKAPQERTAEVELDDANNRETETNDEDDTQAQRPSWRSLFNFTSRSHIFILLLAITFSVASGVVIPTLAFFLGKQFDSFTSFGAGEISGPDLVKKVSTYGIKLAGLGLASGLLNGGYFILWLLFGELQARNVRGKLFEGMLEKDMDWYDMRKAGVDTLISRMHM